jgi:ribosomal protein S18 acetylase RimI-like enzyme
MSKQFEIIKVDKNNINLLVNFIANLGEAANTFRYFNTRAVDVIADHLVTLLLLQDDVPAGYAHLDPEDQKTWLGICILPQYSGMGLGNLMMIHLLEKAKLLNIKSIELTVDKVNLPAIKLYEKFNFKKIKETNTNFQYKLALE